MLQWIYLIIQAILIKYIIFYLLKIIANFKENNLAYLYIELNESSSKLSICISLNFILIYVIFYILN